MQNQDVEVFFDGQCPLCRREIDWLRRMDSQQRIAFTDISEPTFSPSAQGLSLSREALMGRIHGRLRDGTIVEGVEVFRRLYGAVGWQRAVAVSRWPGVRQALDVAYDVFAKNRLWLTGRGGKNVADGGCDTGTCAVKRPA